MASLTVDLGNNDVLIFHFATIRTASYEVTPVNDTLSGQHFEGVKVTLDIVGLVSEVTIATNKPNPNVVGAVGKTRRTDPNNNGDRLPFTMVNIRDALMHPRRRIIYEVGGEVVLDLPRPDAAGDPAVCDARGGPFPERASFTGITGDKLAVLSYRVTGYDIRNDQILLSNAWSITNTVDANGYETRTVQGRACFRRDALESNRLSADDMRRHLAVPTPAGMRRMGVHVHAAANGHEVEYSFHDRQVSLGLGENSRVVSVTGSVTSGVVSPIRNIADALGMPEKIFNQAVDNPFGMPGFLWRGLVPVSTNVAVFRATGQKGVNRRLLSATAISFALDRFSPLALGQAIPFAAVAAPPLAKSTIVSIHVTHNADTDAPPWAEVRLEIMGLNLAVLTAIFTDEPEAIMKLDEQIGGVASILQAAPTLPAGGNTRGSTLARLVTQALEAPTPQNVPTQANLPASPRPNVGAGDVPAPV